MSILIIRLVFETLRDTMSLKTSYRVIFQFFRAKTLLLKKLLLLVSPLGHLILLQTPYVCKQSLVCHKATHMWTVKLQGAYKRQSWTLRPQGAQILVRWTRTLNLLIASEMSGSYGALRLPQFGNRLVDPCDQARHCRTPVFKVAKAAAAEAFEDGLVSSAIL